MPDLTMTIDGRSVSGAACLGVINPATGKVFASAPECGREELDEAMQSSARAFTAWRSIEAKRREAEKKAADSREAAEGHRDPGAKGRGTPPRTPARPKGPGVSPRPAPPKRGPIR